MEPLYSDLSLGNWALLGQNAVQAGGNKVRLLGRPVVPLQIFTCALVAKVGPGQGDTAEKGPRILQIGLLNREKPEEKKISVSVSSIRQTCNAGDGEGGNWSLPGRRAHLTPTTHAHLTLQEPQEAIIRTLFLLVSKVFFISVTVHFGK